MHMQFFLKVISGNDFYRKISFLGLVHENSSSCSSDEESEMEGTYDIRKNEIHVRRSNLESVSSASTVSSMNTAINEDIFVVDPKRQQLRHQRFSSSFINSSFTGIESSQSSNESANVDPVDQLAKESVTAASLTPELPSEKQKEFQNKRNMFQDLAEKNYENKNKQTIVASANVQTGCMIAPHRKNRSRARTK